MLQETQSHNVLQATKTVVIGVLSMRITVLASETAHRQVQGGVES